MPYELEVPFGDDWETVRRNFQNLRKDMNPPVPQARAYNNAAITLANNTETTLTFNSERFNSGDLHSTSSNTGRMTAPITGLYLVGADVSFASNATGVRFVGLRVTFAAGGTANIAYDERQAVNGDTTIIPIVSVYQLTAGDYVEVRAFQNSGGNLNVASTANYSPEFWMVRLGGFVNQGV